MWEEEGRRLAFCVEESLLFTAASLLLFLLLLPPRAIKPGYYTCAERTTTVSQKRKKKDRKKRDREKNPKAARGALRSLRKEGRGRFFPPLFFSCGDWVAEDFFLPCCVRVKNQKFLLSFFTHSQSFSPTRISYKDRFEKALFLTLFFSLSPPGCQSMSPLKFLNVPHNNSRRGKKSLQEEKEAK